MRLSGLQDLLSEFYALDLEYEVDDFVTTDEKLARALDGGGRELDEKLLIAETTAKRKSRSTWRNDSSSASSAAIRSRASTPTTSKTS